MSVIISKMDPPQRGSTEWWEQMKGYHAIRKDLMLGPFDNTGQPYWKEVGRGEFEERMLYTFSAPNAEDCVGFWDGTRHRPYPPEVRLGDGHLVIHQETAIYDDFKIDWSGAGPRYFLHNYSFAV